MNVLYLAQRHVTLRRVSSTKGGEYQGACPGCGDGGSRQGKDGPSNRFHVNPAQDDGQGTFWCRQCGKKGDAIQFLRDFEGLSFQDACDRLGRTIPESRSLSPKPPAQPSWEPRKYDSPTQKWQEKAMKFTNWAYERVFQSQRALCFLADRGISEETIGRVGLGWNRGRNGKDLYRSRESWGLSKIVSKKGKVKLLWVPKGLVIPWIFNGTVQRIRIRRFGELEFGPRYYILPGGSVQPMMLSCRDKEVYVIVESELDAILLSQEVGDIVGLISLGSASLKPDTTAFKVLSHAAQILVALDDDDAGAKSWKWWKENFPRTSKRWPVPKGKDPGEAYQKKVDLRAWIIDGLADGLRMRLAA